MIQGADPQLSPGGSCHVGSLHVAMRLQFASTVNTNQSNSLHFIDMPPSVTQGQRSLLASTGLWGTNARRLGILPRANLQSGIARAAVITTARPRVARDLHRASEARLPGDSEDREPTELPFPDLPTPDSSEEEVPRPPSAPEPDNPLPEELPPNHPKVGACMGKGLGRAHKVAR